MAGLYERVKEQGNIPDDRIPALLIVSVMGGYGTSKLDASQAQFQLDDYLTRNNKPLLRPDEIEDLQNIATQINSKSGVSSKIDYIYGQLQIATLTAETGNVKNDAGFRALLDIPEPTSTKSSR